MSLAAALPLHPLVVHGAVVLLPLAALGVIALAFVPKWRNRYAALVLVVSLIALAAMPLAAETGEQLANFVGEGGLVAQHAELGETGTAVAALNLLGALGIWWIARRRRIGNPVKRRLTAIITVFAVLAAVGACVQVFRIGHSGAQATWAAVANATPAAENDD